MSDWRKEGKKYYQQKFHKEFLKDLEERNEHYRAGKIKILTEYKNVKEHIEVQTDKGIHKVYPDSLLNGVMPSVISLVDRVRYCENFLKNMGLDIKVVNADNFRRIVFKTPYGLCRRPLRSFRTYKSPTIASAIDKTAYMIGEFKEVHGDRYDYSKSKYTEAKGKVNIICKKHGEFEQSYISHKRGSNCQKCARNSEKIKENGGWSVEEWGKLSTRSENFVNFRVYILKCEGNGEKFYKIGRTFTNVAKRYRHENHLPYKWIIERIFECDEPSKAYYLEKELLKINKEYKYTPKIKFHGINECFTKWVGREVGIIKNLK